MATVVCAFHFRRDVLYGRGCIIPLFVERMVGAGLALLRRVGSIPVVVFGFYFLVSHGRFLSLSTSSMIIAVAPICAQWDRADSGSLGSPFIMAVTWRSIAP